MTDCPAKCIAKDDQVHNWHHEGHDDNKRVTEEFFEIPFENCDRTPDHNGLLPPAGFCS